MGSGRIGRSPKYFDTVLNAGAEMAKQAGIKVTNAQKFVMGFEKYIPTIGYGNYGNYAIIRMQKNQEWADEEYAVVRWGLINWLIMNVDGEREDLKTGVIEPVVRRLGELYLKGFFHGVPRDDIKVRNKLKLLCGSGPAAMVDRVRRRSMMKMIQQKTSN